MKDLQHRLELGTEVSGEISGYLSEVRAFVEVVHRDGFSSAARSLGISSSTVSKHVARLETKMGVQLIQRSTHGLYVTDAGREFYKGCYEAFQKLEAADKSARNMSQNLTGNLRIHVSMALSQTIISPAILEFMRQYPEISIELSTGSPGVNPMEHRFDIAFRTSNLRERAPGNVSVRRRVLGTVDYAIVASPQYIEQFGAPSSPSDLSSHRCLILTTQANAEAWQFKGTAEDQIVCVSGGLRSNNWMIIRDAALRGLGIARLLEFTVLDELQAGKLQPLLLGIARSSQRIQAFVPHAPNTPVKIKKLLDFLDDYIQRHQSPRFLKNKITALDSMS